MVTNDLQVMGRPSDQLGWRVRWSPFTHHRITSCVWLSSTCPGHQAQQGATWCGDGPLAPDPSHQRRQSEKPSLRLCPIWTVSLTLIPIFQTSFQKQVSGHNGIPRGIVNAGALNNRVAKTTVAIRAESESEMCCKKSKASCFGSEISCLIEWSTNPCVASTMGTSNCALKTSQVIAWG